MDIRAVIFDFDGVIADSERLHYELYQAVLEPFGAGFTWKEYLDRWIALHDAGCIAAVLEDRNLPATPERIAELVEEKERLFLERLRKGRIELFAGVADLIASLAGELPLAVCSGALREEVVAVLENHGLRRHFTVITGAQDTARHKPDPEPYERTLAELNARAGEAEPMAAAECLVFEDTPDGVRAAKGAGMICVGITNSCEAGALGAADATIETFEDLDLEALRRRLGL